MTDKEMIESLEVEEKPKCFLDEKESGKSVFEILNTTNVNGRTEKVSNGQTELTYLSWAWAWAEVKNKFPNAQYEIVKFNGLPYVFDELTGYMVYTRVTINGLTHEMWLPVMDSANKAMKATPYTYKVKNKNFKYATKNESDGKYYDKYGNEQTEYIEKTTEAATMFDINKTIMRCLTKNLAMHGLGLYIYAGEDLPEKDKADVEEEMKSQLAELYKKAGGKNFEKWIADCGGLTAETFPVMKTKLLKQINDNAEKEKK